MDPRERPRDAHGCEIDRPAAPTRSDRAHAAVTGREQGAGNAVRTESCGNAIERPSFADRAEIDLDTWTIETDRAATLVDHHVLHADGFARRGDLGVLRQAPLAAQKAPRPAQRGGGDVERASGLGMEVMAETQQLQQIGVHRHGTLGGRAIELGDRARFAEDGELRLEGVHAIECRAGGRDVTGVFAAERDLEAAGHGAAVHADPVIRLGRRAVGFAAQQIPPADHG